MRMLTGVAIDGRVVEMALPSDVALAHLMPDLLAALEVETAHVRPRRVDGRWLDLERSLGEQGCTSGGIVCLETPEAEQRRRRHDPVARIVERGPPVELVLDAAVPAAFGAAVSTALVVAVDRAAPVLVALAPCAWAILPLLGGMVSAGDGGGVRRLFGTLALVLGSGALAASSQTAVQGPFGAALDGCLTLAVLAHVMRRRSARALVRVVLGIVEWLSLSVVLPLTSFAAGWSHP